MAMLASFIGRALASTHIFCYEAISSAGVVLILPGYTIRASRFGRTSS
jgi:uncharacterized membrane protein YjjP (DUF1212 family)